METFHDPEDPEQELLHASRNGEAEDVAALLEKRKNGQLELDINCKGRNKANLGWSPLHLASYFGHTDVVLLLLQNDADLNIVNHAGDTPLHRAAYTGRVDVVMLLLKFNADVSLINAEGHTPKEMAKDPEIRRIIDAAESVSQRKRQEELFQAVREGDMDRLSTMLGSFQRTPTSGEGNSALSPSINCTDPYGNTALHTAAYRGRKEVAVLLLQHGIDPGIKNNSGQVAADMARDSQMKQVLELEPIKAIQKTVKRFEGVLQRKYKLLGWKPCWVVLERGVISVFAKRADSTAGGKRKTYKYLDNAKVKIRNDVAHIFTMTFSDDSSMTLAVEPKNNAPIKRQRWENALRQHIAYSTHYLQAGEAHVSDDEEEEERTNTLPLGSMEDALQTAKANQQVLEHQVSMVTGSVDSLAEERSNKSVAILQIRVQLSQIVETSQHMCGTLSHCLNLLAQQEEVRKRAMEQEVEKSRVLQEALHVLAEEHHDLEQSLGGHLSPSLPYLTDDDSDGEGGDEYYDCDDDSTVAKQFQEALDDKSSDSNGSVSPSSDSSHDTTLVVNGKSKMKPSKTTVEKSVYGGRCRLPVPSFSRNDFSIWSILKQCIGKELSKITMPVIFNEPLSFVQRIIEYMEYAKLLELASQCTDPIKRLEYVAAFAVSATASNWERIGKPFNPLLGETYELQRDDLGFRIVSEQVSHHPPISAFHADSPHYVFHGAIHPKLKFWGKSVEVTPKGIVTLKLLKHDEVYTWQNVNCCVHNIIVGKLWIELYGAMEVTNHKTKHKAVLNFKPSGWFGKDLHKVEGYIFDSNKTKLRALYGKWVEGLYSYDVEVWENYQKSKNLVEANSPKGADDPPDKGSTCNLQLPNQRCLWLALPRPEECTQYYNFSLFAMMLNELEEGQIDILPPTDARLRPDIRKLEEGDIDGAAQEKNRVEERQRHARKDRKRLKQDWFPNWFRLGTNPHTGKEDWLFTNRYWNREWPEQADIF